MARDDLHMGAMLAQVLEAARDAETRAEETLTLMRSREPDLRLVHERLNALERAATVSPAAQLPPLSKIVAILATIGVVIVSLGAAISLVLHPQYLPLLLQVLHGQPAAP